MIAKKRGGLILSRRLGESIVIGDAVVSVVKISGGRVWLATSAPASVPVHRAEVAGSMGAGVVSLARELRDADLEGLAVA